MEMCPVCNKESAKKSINGIIDGIIYYFCCQQCKENFIAEFRKFINCCEENKGGKSSCDTRGNENG